MRNVVYLLFVAFSLSLLFFFTANVHLSSKSSIEPATVNLNDVQRNGKLSAYGLKSVPEKDKEKSLNLSSKATMYSETHGKYHYHPLFNLKLLSQQDRLLDNFSTSNQLMNQNHNQVPIFLDFYFDRIDFGSNNYLVLDSLLKFQPNANIYISIFAFHLHTFYHFSDVLSEPTFLKYLKSGYNVEILRHHDNYRFQNLDPGSESKNTTTPNMQWYASFTKEKDKYKNSLPMSMARKIDHFKVEETLAFFTRLANLYHNGGFYSDFAILWFTNLFDFVNEYLENHFEENSSALTLEDMVNEINSETEKDARSEHFPQRATNIIDICEDSYANVPHMFLYFPKLQDPTIKCLLEKISLLDTCLAEKNLNEEGTKSQYGRIKCYKNLLKACGKMNLDTIIQWESKRVDHIHSTIEVQGHSMVSGFKVKEENEGNKISIERGNIFLSEYGYGKSWQRFTLMVNGHNVDYETILQIPMGNSVCRQEKHHGRCRIPQASSSQFSKEAQKLEICAPSFFIPGTQKGASSFLFHILALHPQILLPLEGSQYKETGVYIKKNIIGNKPLSTTERIKVFPYISTRYQKELNRNQNPIETGLVSRDENQINYIDESQYYISGDGTVIYMYVQGAFQLIYKDNPDAKFIFALRNPIDRAFSDYKFNYIFFSRFNNGTSFEDLVENSINSLEYDCKFNPSAVLELIQNLDDLNGKENLLLVDILDKYYYHTDICPEYIRTVDPHAIILRGVYFQGVLNFLQAFPFKQMKVVTTEELKVSTIQEKTKTNEVLQEVFSFLDLCPYNFDPSLLVPIHQTGSSIKVKDVPPISLEIREKLKQFYKPYNEALYALIGRDLGWN